MAHIAQPSASEYDGYSYLCPPSDIFPTAEFYEWNYEWGRWRCKMCDNYADPGHLHGKTHERKLYNAQHKQAAAAQFPQLALGPPPLPPWTPMPHTAVAGSSSAAVPQGMARMDDGDLLKAVAELTARTDKMAEQLTVDKAIDFDNNASLLTAVAKLIDNNAALLKAVAELTAKVEEMAKQLGKVEEQVTWVRT